MTQMQLLKKLDEWDEKGSWVLTMDRFYMYFHNESKESIKKALVRHEQSGLLERICKGIYANPRALSKTRVYNKLAYISNFIRDKGLSYLSLETVLSENNIISQNPNRDTFISKGQSRVFYTPYGIIEIHTLKEKRKIYIAIVILMKIGKFGWLKLNKLSKMRLNLIDVSIYLKSDKKGFRMDIIQIA